MRNISDDILVNKQIDQIYKSILIKQVIIYLSISSAMDGQTARPNELNIFKTNIHNFLQQISLLKLD